MFFLFVKGSFHDVGFFMVFQSFVLIIQITFIGGQVVISSSDVRVVFIDAVDLLPDLQAYELVISRLLVFLKSGVGHGQIVVRKGNIVMYFSETFFSDKERQFMVLETFFQLSLMRQQISSVIVTGGNFIMNNLIIVGENRLADIHGIIGKQLRTQLVLHVTQNSDGCGYFGLIKSLDSLSDC